MAPDPFPDPAPDPSLDQRWTTGVVSARALDCVADVLDLAAGAAGRSRGLVALCRLGAELVDADAAAHVRHDRTSGSTQLCVWTPARADRGRWEERSEPPSARETSTDWWTTSPSRQRLFDLLACAHLAELPLSVQRTSPSLLVMGRAEPFREAESTRLTTVHATLLLLERLVDVLLPAPPAPQRDRRPEPGAVDPAGSAAALTTREREVLELLGEGLLARSIAARLEVSERTVHKHLGSIYRKLDAHDRLLAVRRGESLGFIPTSPDPETAAVR